jgi:hypothetical protein
MKAHVLREPELEFRAGNRHIDPRYGIAVYGPADADSQSAPHAIPVGIVGPPQSVDGLRSWLQRCLPQEQEARSGDGAEATSSWSAPVMARSTRGVRPGVRL